MMAAATESATRSAIEEPEPAQRPFIRVRWDGTRVLMDGTASVLLGHRLSHPGDCRTDGIFIEWNWDGRALRLRSDRYGFQPMYYYLREGELCLSPSIPHLIELGAPRDLDVDGLAVFLRLGFFLGCDTAFRAIRALPPGCTMVWEQGRFQMTSERPEARPIAISPQAALDEYIDRFGTAMRRRPCRPDDCGIPLSGGRDSRHLFLELVTTGRRPAFCATVDPRFYGGAEHPEVTSARQLAGRAGVPHAVVRQRECRFAAERRKNLLTNLCSDEHTAFLALAEYLRGRAGVIYDGLAGDVLSAGLFLEETRLASFERGDFEGLALELLGEIEVLLRRIVSAAWMRRLSHDRAVARLVTELAAHQDQPNPVGSFFFWNRTRREIALAPTCLFGRAATVYCPYLDPDVYDFLAGLPASLLLDHSFHTRAIARAYPDYADVPYCETKPRGVDRRHARHLAARALMLVHATALRGGTNYSGSVLRYGRQLLSPVDDGWASICRTIYLAQLHDLERMRANPSGAESRTE